MEDGQRPSFSSPLYAALRQGAKELGQALQAFPDGMRVVEEPGTLGNPTAQLVTAGIEGSYSDRVAERYAAQEQQQPEPEREVER